MVRLMAVLVVATGVLLSPVAVPGATIVGWGWNNRGQVDVPTVNDFIAIASGCYHSLALKSDGSIVSWGWDRFRQVSDTPTDMGFTAIAAGSDHSLALMSAPIPEPASIAVWSVLATAGIGFGWRRRRAG